MEHHSRRQLDLIGITYNQIESGVYALILQEHGGTRRLPIIIGYSEAQAIECKLQEIVTPRPLTHDLIVSVMATFDLSLKEVEIYQLDNGVFAANLVVTNATTVRKIDARSSDAIAMAIRVGAPIYTSEELIERIGFSQNKETETPDEPTAETDADATHLSNSLELQSDIALKQMMDTAAENENYEEAARIKAEIDRRKNQQPEL